MKKSNRILCLYFILIAATVQAQQSKKMNVLFIAIDDLKPNLGCYGDKIVKTPNIDRLAKMGTMFMSNYCQQSVCGPTRASLMTGMRPDYTKIWDLKTQMRDMNPDILTLPQYLISMGYNTAGVGKIYHPSSAINKIDPASWNQPYPEATANDYPNGMGKPANTQYQNPATKLLFTEKKQKTSDNDEDAASKKGPSTECLDVPDNAYEDGVNALFAKGQIISMSKMDKPFFLAVGFHKPHLPFVAPKKYWDLYNRSKMPLAEFQEHSSNGPEIAYHRSSELRNYTDIPEAATFNEVGNHVRLKEEKQKELIQGYYASVSYTDAQVGILLNTLDSLGTLNNTLIVLWGDHGWHLGDHDLWEKHTNFEAATRAPLIIAAPGYAPGKTQSISEHLDIFPTICDLVKVPIPAHLQGKTLKPILQNKQTQIQKFAISQYPRKLSKEEMDKGKFTSNKIMGYSLRTNSYRLTIWMNDFTTDQAFEARKVFATELYDYTKDPLEKYNVFEDKKYTNIAQEMKNNMLQFFAAQVHK
jgi:arylsulfatase A-like enzyme